VSCPKYSYERLLRHGGGALFAYLRKRFTNFHDSRHAGALRLACKRPKRATRGNGLSAVTLHGLAASVTDQHLVPRQLGHGMGFASAGWPHG
jgi:hypothetical protein